MSANHPNVPYGYCECGCGEKTSLAPRDDKRFGHTKGEPVRFRVGHANRQQPVDHFWDRVEMAGDDECWEWTGQVGSSPYGQSVVFGRKVLAHRLSWEMHNCEPAGDRHVHHACHNPICVNPTHLEAIAPVRHREAHRSERTACGQGHAWTPENTYITKRGTRSCRACARAYQARLRAERNGPWPTKVCPGCGEEFQPTERRAQKYCCESCRSHFYYLRRKGKLNQLKHKHRGVPA